MVFELEFSACWRVKTKLAYKYFYMEYQLCVILGWKIFLYVEFINKKSKVE